MQIFVRCPGQDACIEHVVARASGDGAVGRRDSAMRHPAGRASCARKSCDKRGMPEGQDPRQTRLVVYDSGGIVSAQLVGSAPRSGNGVDQEDMRRSQPRHYFIRHPVRDIVVSGAAGLVCGNLARWRDSILIERQGAVLRLLCGTALQRAGPALPTGRPSFVRGSGGARDPPGRRGFGSGVSHRNGVVHLRG